MAGNHGEIAADAGAARTTADLARLLRELRRREARGRGGPELTYREISDRTGWSVSVIGGYFTGVKLPSTERFDDLVRLLGARAHEQGVLATARERVEPSRADACVGAAPPPHGAAPRMLPARVAGFTGRLGALAALDGLPTADPGPGAVTIAAVDGMAGVGKTTLAVQWAHGVATDFPDGQLYVNLRGYDPKEPLSVMDALEALLQGLGVAPAALSCDLPGRVAQYHGSLAGRRMLVLLDNACGSDQVRPLLPPAPNVAVVTSRDELVELVTVDTAVRVALDVLPEDEAVALLSLLIGARADREPDAVRRLARRCGHLPLALRVAAEHAAARPTMAIAELVAELDDASNDLDALGVAGDERADLRVVFSWSLRRLPAPAARAFGLLGLVPGNDIDVYGLAALFGVALPEAEQLAQTLVRAHLIQREGHGRFSMHDLLRAYVRESVEQRVRPGERRAATSRLLDHYLAATTVAIDLQYPDRAPARPRNRPEPAWPTQPPILDSVRAAADWLAVERDNLVRACRHAAGNGWPGHALALALALRPALENGHDDDGLTVLGEALRAAQLSGGADDPRDLADVGVWLAFTNWRLGRIDVAAAHIQHALDEHTRLAWAEGITHCLAVLGAVRYSQGRLADAVDCERRGLEVARRAGNRLQEAGQLNNLGWLHLRLDDHPAAAGYYERATRLAEQDGHTPHAAECAVGLAAAYAGLGRYDEALALVEQALIVDVEHDLLPQRVEAMATMGNIYRLQCSHLDAIEQHTIAFALCRDLDHPALTAIVLTNLGEAHLAAGDHTSASDCYRRALDFAAKGGDRIEQARAWTGLGDARCTAGEPRQAREYWQQAYHSYLEMGHPTAEHVRARLSAGRLVGQR